MQTTYSYNPSSRSDKKHLYVNTADGDKIGYLDLPHDVWLALSMTRCTLLVDSEARAFCEAAQPDRLPVPVVRMTSGLSVKHPKSAACCTEDPAWMYSSTVLGKWLGVTPSS